MVAHGFNAIPQTDLSLADDAVRRPELLQQLRHALTDVGFLYVKNHGVPEKVIADLVTVALPAISGLSAETKAEISLEHSPHFLGYSAVGSETTAGLCDQREQIEFATELPARWSPGRPLYERLIGPNQWPSSNPELRPAVETYIHHLTLLGDRFLRLVAEALSLPPATFLPFLSDQHRLKLVRYPGIDADGPEETEPIQGVGPHKDSSGWWTFLLQASPPGVGGLQALNRRGEWIDVPSVPGTFVVNIGQAFEVVTHGVCPATTHRVVRRPGRERREDRYSVPFFQGVRLDLTKGEALGGLREHFCGGGGMLVGGGGGGVHEPSAGQEIDSAFLRGNYDTWGESQLRTKVRSHRDAGRRFYAEVCEAYLKD